MEPTLNNHHITCACEKCSKYKMPNEPIENSKEWVVFGDGKNIDTEKLITISVGEVMTMEKIEELSKKIKTLLLEQRIKILNFIDKNYLEYCRQQNGREDCKNCGLNLEEIKKELEDNKSPKL